MHRQAEARPRGRMTRMLPMGAFTALTIGFAFELWRHIGTGGDFWTLWAASRAVGAGLDPYRTSVLLRMAPLPPGPAPGAFLSPLFVAQFLQPLAGLPFGAARMVWLVSNLFASGLLLYLLLLAGGFKPTTPVLLAGTALLMAFQPFDITLWLGQTDVLVVTAVAVGWCCLARGRPVLGGLAASLAAVDVHLLLGFGFYFVYQAVGRRHYRPLAGLTAGLVALSALCLLHPADVARWLLVTLPHAQAAAIEPWDTLSVLQAAMELLGRHGALAAVAVVDVGMLLLAVAAWRRPGTTLQDDLAVAAVLTLATTTFAYNQDYLLLVLAFPFIAGQWRRVASPWWTGALAFALAVGFGLAELTGGLVAPGHAAFIVGAPLLALALVIGVRGEHLTGAYRFWAAAWVAATLGGYAAFTWSRWEVGPELLLLSGVITFMLLVGLHGGRSGSPPARVPGRRVRDALTADAAVGPSAASACHVSR